jgi:hypothetical protein
MKWWIAAACCSLIGAPAFAGSYRIVLEKPKDGKMLVGHAGVQAIDERTATTLVRVISPGAEVSQRGTIRILVMNLGSKPFEFGPDQVRLTLADGTVLQPASVDQYEKGRVLVERESRYANTTDIRNRNNLSGLEQQTNGGAIQSFAPAKTGTSVTGADAQDHRTDETLMPGAETLNAIYQILVVQPVLPNKAWGGYYVFDMPKTAFARRADQPMAIWVKTGDEEHRFNAILKWK